MKSEFRTRVHIVLLFVILFASVLVARLYFIQIVNGEELSLKSDRQYTKPGHDLFNRGSIFFKDKNETLVSAATLKSGFTVAINPNVIEDAKVLYIALSEIIDLDEVEFLARAAKEDDPYEEIARRVDAARAEKITNLEIPGVKVYRDRWRFYPGGELAAQTVGFVGFDDNVLSGRYGLERYYEDTLGREDKSLYTNFFAEVFSGLGSAIRDGEIGHEGDVVTSIEPSVQVFLERSLVDISDTWDSKLTGGVIIDPVSGDIVALGVYPTFDLNSFQKEKSSAVFANPLVENVYEMGSIIKPLTMAIGIDSGAVIADTAYYDSGSIDIDGATISNFDGKGRKRVPMQEVLNQSLNTGAAFIMKEVGKEDFRDYMLSLGLEEETGIDLPNESAGLVANLYSPRTLEYATASFGQGIAMTPIATVRALGALANDGMTITPHIAQEIAYTSGLSKKVTFGPPEQVFKSETAEEVTRMLVQVVDEALLDGAVKRDRYSVAAKTGTAQIAKSGERGYYDDRFLHSFFGYVPAYDPQFLVFLFTVEPKEVRYASQTLTHPFSDIVTFLINYFEIQPDR
tara:strand:- start:1627 stop:3339 length:1713 start_codon:yes stop_codon:yes gene_type:complete